MNVTDIYDTITALEELKAAAAGAQAVLTTHVADTIRRQRRDAVGFEVRGAQARTAPRAR